MKEINKISKEELDSINKSFSSKGEEKVLRKGKGGELLGVEKRRAAVKPIKIVSAEGRIVRHMKSVVMKDGRQITVAKKGDVFSKIPLSIRNLVTWSDSDFEK